MPLAGWGVTRRERQSAARKPADDDDASCRTPAPASSKTKRFYRPTTRRRVQMCTLDAAGEDERRLLRRQRRPGDRPRAPTAPRSSSAVISTGGPVCSTKLPNVFTRVDYVSTWVSEWIAATESGGPPPIVDPSRRCRR